MNQKNIKEKIKKLIEKLERLDVDQVKAYSEANTRKDFILPLFQALGWDIHNKNAQEVIEEEAVSRKKVDYAFKIDGITKFYLEAKKLNENLDQEKWIRQAIEYAYHKSAPWAILTNFKTIKVYNVEWDELNIEQNIVFELDYKNFLKRFNNLWSLSKSGFEENTLDTMALKHGNKPKKRPMDKQLAEDLIRWRDLLCEELGQYNPTIKSQKISEAVQTILDRLIFIRTAEDREIENKLLQPLVRSWDEKGNLIRSLNKLFRQFDRDYNSKLFEPHFCEELNKHAEDSVYIKIITELYKNQRGIRYNFADIPADVFGSIYEQYLGYIQQENQQKKDKTSKRKSQGIYYTPRYIVDYIVKNTLGQILETKSQNEIKNIKILDPACGSGSFLIKAFEELAEYWRDKENKKIKYDKNTHLGKIEQSFKARQGQKPLPVSRKMELLRNNIHGVDLDKEAVEIAQLNLLVRALDRRQRLPNLSGNIAHGNSLISGTEKELKKYFGKNWQDKKPFNWKQEFSEVFDKGGFDVVIGNPPYIDSEELVRKDRNFRIYCSDNYKSAKGNWDIFCIFIQRSIDLLKKGGYFGMIIPNKLLSADYAKSIREIIKKYSIISINDYSNIKVFGANVYPIVIIIKKVRPRLKHNIFINSYKKDKGKIRLENSKKVSQMLLEKHKNSWSPVFGKDSNMTLLGKITEKSMPLDNFCDIHGAATVGEAYEIKKIIRNYDGEKDYFKFINTGTIDRYTSLWAHKKTQYIKASYNKPIATKKQLKNLLPKRCKDSKSCKVIVAGMTKKLECFLDEKGEYFAGKSTVIIQSNTLDLKFVLAVLNSKLLSFIYRNIFKSLSLQGGYLRIGVPQIKKLPLIVPSKNKITKITKLTNRIIKLNKELQKLDPIMDEKECEKKKKEIERVDKMIGERVYGLYGLGKKEIEAVERSYE
ncbi:hypothetical protein CL633_02280 [bacterium]|nr:hypothetical protein [bacterium]|tara:strand:- start:4080 stop:6875 length:2796 start_codon:yes stop_codon:yes gene_type:complete